MYLRCGRPSTVGDDRFFCKGKLFKKYRVNKLDSVLTLDMLRG